MRFITITISAALALASPAFASNVTGEINGAYIAHTWGGELGAGYHLNTPALPGFNITPVVGAFIYKGNNARYYVDTFPNGQSRCRDRTDGQFANSGLCGDTSYAAYGRLEASYSFAGVSLGGGARYDTLVEKVRPYGTVSIPLAPGMRIKANGWKDYYSLGIAVNY